MENINSVFNTNIDNITISSIDLELNNEISDTSERKFNINEKKILVSRIEQIKNKKVYLKLFKIISDDDNNYVINNNGIFLNFNNVKDITLLKIEKLLNLYDKIKKEKIMNSKWKNILENQYNINSDINDESINKLTNYEKNFIKKNKILNKDDVVYWGEFSTSN
jgi:hypothetical protein